MKLPAVRFGPVQLTHSTASRYRDAADAVTRAFCWQDSPEGDPFWRSVYDRLKEMEAVANGALPVVKPDADMLSPEDARKLMELLDGRA